VEHIGANGVTETHGALDIAVAVGRGALARECHAEPEDGGDLPTADQKLSVAPRFRL
jgi:hypothetical protein